MLTAQARLSKGMQFSDAISAVTHGNCKSCASVLQGKDLRQADARSRLVRTRRTRIVSSGNSKNLTGCHLY